jgi:hypothetical protein
MAKLCRLRGLYRAGTPPASIDSAPGMAVSNPPLSTEAHAVYGTAARQTGAPAAALRVDAAHEIGGRQPGMEAETPAAVPPDDEPEARQLQSQAAQLAAHLRDREKELDHREAQLNAHIARFEAEVRAVQLSLEEREAAVAAAEQLRLEDHQENCGNGAGRGEGVFAAGTAAGDRSLASLSAQEHELLDRERELRLREREVGRRLTRLALAQAAQEREKDLADERQAAAARASEQAEQMIAEYRLAAEELDRKRIAVERRATRVEQFQAALKRLRAELGRVQRETLENRLATEELWAQLSGAAPPATLSQSLARIRAKLSDQYRQANLELTEQKKDLEQLRAEIDAQRQKLIEHKSQFERWLAAHQEELKKQAARLVAREKYLEQKELRCGQESRRWQSERIKCQTQTRRLQAALRIRGNTRLTGSP